jgi:hypothetical protein
LESNLGEDKVKALMFLRIKSGRLILALVILWWAFSCAAVCCGQSPQPLSAPGPQQTPQALDTNTQQSGSVNGAITGTIVDPSGAVVPGATVMLTRDNLNPEPSTTSAPNTGTSKKGTLSGNDGRFVFANIPPGLFHLTIISAGFATQSFSGVLQSGENQAIAIALAMAEAITEVEVGLTQTEVAEEEIKIEEKQRVLGVFPNFYVSYIPNAAPLNSKQKFELAWKSVIDPVTFALVGVTAGVEQADNYFSGYGQGAQGYAKRFGAGYADTISGTFIGGAILPSLLKQDPRYFYKGTGSKRSRALYAIANAFICKGDNKRWQPNYSGILGSLAAGGISNLYYPASDRNGAALTFENAAIGIGGTAISNLLQEFVIRKLTPKVPNDPANPK